MPILDAALAFALTMLVIATVVTYIVRALQNAVKLRNSELQKMLAEYAGSELQPVVERELIRLKKDMSAEVASQWAQAACDLDRSSLFPDKELATLLEVSTDELTERLKRSPLGEKLLRELGDEAQAVFDELGRRYEVIGDKFTVLFRERSRLWASAVAVVLAIALNIDSIHVADSYIRNESLRQAVIAQGDALTKDYEALAEALEKEEAKDSVTKEELEQAFNDTLQQVDLLANAGFPIGWSHFPHAGLQNADSNEFMSRNNVGGWLMWGMGILLTGLLAGLGAPFWYDTVTGISRVAQKTRAANNPAT